jgi:hypothetical protein
LTVPASTAWEELSFKIMDLTNDAAIGGSEATSIAVAPAPAGETPPGAREAARNLADWRQSREKLRWRPQASGEGGDRRDPPPAPEQETAARELCRLNNVRGA